MNKLQYLFDMLTITLKQEFMTGTIVGHNTVWEDFFIYLKRKR